MIDKLINKVLNLFKGENPFMRVVWAVGLIVLFLGGLNALMNSAFSGGDDDAGRALPVSVQSVHYLDSHLVRHQFTGNIVAGRRSNLGFEVGGRIAHVYKDNGDYALKGEALAALDMSRTEARLRSLQAQKQDAKARLHLAERSRVRREETYQDNHTSEQVLDEAIANEASARAQLERINADIDLLEVDLRASTLKAPFDGFVDRRLLDEGEIVGAGTPIFNFLEKENYEAQVGVPNEYISLLSLGSAVDLESESGEKLTAQVVRISPAIRGDTRTQLLTLSLDENQTAQFGALVTLHLNSQRNARGFWVPITALTADVRGLWRLYRVDEVISEDHPVTTIVIENVQILHVEGADVFVTGSLNEGAKIISVGVPRLSPHQRVQVLSDTSSNLGLIGE